MRLRFLELPADDRRVYIEQAAIRRNVSPVLLEKDFWVCWLLGIIFESEFAEHQHGRTCTAARAAAAVA